MEIVIPEITVTPSEVLKYLFCPRFTWFEHVLKIPEHEEKRFKVMEGREVHRVKQVRNPDYLRKRQGVVDREKEVYLSAPRLHLRGIVDEVLTLEDGTMAPLDYKFAEWKQRLYKTYRMQLILYGILIRENYGYEVCRGFLVYTRSRNYLLEVPIKPSDFEKAGLILEEIIGIISGEKLPNRTSSRNRCADCAYKNICV